MKVLICGSRNFSDKQLIRSVIMQLPKDTVIIQGGARGADHMAKLYALERGMIVEEYLPNWDELGKKAGPLRNQEMIDKGHPDKVIAFFYDMENSKGTWDMIRRSEKANIPIDTIVSKGIS